MNPPVLERTDVGGLFEDLGKVGLIVESGLFRHIQDGEVGGGQQTLGIFDADMFHIVTKGQPYFLFKELAEVRAIYENMLNHAVQGDFFSIVLDRKSVV